MTSFPVGNVSTLPRVSALPARAQLGSREEQRRKEREDSKAAGQTLGQRLTGLGTCVTPPETEARRQDTGLTDVTEEMGGVAWMTGRWRDEDTDSC